MNIIAVNIRELKFTFYLKLLGKYLIWNVEKDFRKDWIFLLFNN